VIPIKNIRNLKVGLYFLFVGIAIFILGATILFTRLSYPRPSLAPYNSLHADYLDDVASGAIPAVYVMPSVTERDSADYSKRTPGGLIDGVKFPAKYDLRKFNRVSPIRDQGSDGTCWAFGAIASLESALMPDDIMDLSEQHMRYSLSKDGGNPWGFDRSNGDGGTSEMAISYFARWSGAVTEEVDPYKDDTVVRPYALTNKIKPAAHVQTMIKILPANTRDAASVKCAALYLKACIMRYGAVSTAYHMDSDFYNRDTASYYMYDTTKKYATHISAVVGWDDRYPRDKFLQPPAHPGAWIIKNSWGERWGDNGYFYMSYDDLFAADGLVVFTDAEPTDNYDHIYVNDPFGYVLAVGYNNGRGSLMNVFSGGTGERIAAVGMNIAAISSAYEIWINPDYSGKSWVRVAAGTKELPGYYTVTVDEIAITGSRFAVAVLYGNPVKEDYILPVQYAIDGYSSQAVSKPGIGYISYKGVGDGSPATFDWTDVTTLGPGVAACVKAYTVDAGTTATGERVR